MAITPELLRQVDGVSQRVREDLAIEHVAILAVRLTERDGKRNKCRQPPPMCVRTVGKKSKRAAP